MQAPLTGLRVLDLTRYHPGGYLTRLLADFGAEVIKVEHPKYGDPLRGRQETTSYNMVGLHHTKRSIALDIRRPEAKPVFESLVRYVDIVVESARPGSMAADGIGYEAMTHVNPRIVWCSLTAFGQSGPYAHHIGHEHAFISATGLLERLEPGDDKLPHQEPVVFSSPTAGAIGAASILAGVVRRERTGLGCHIDAGIADAVQWLLSEEVTRDGRGLGRYDTRRPNWATYRCGDGRRVSVVSIEPAAWSKVCAALEIPQYAAATPGLDEDLDAELRIVLADRFATKPAVYWIERLGDAGVNPFNRLDETFDDPHVRARGRIVDLETDYGTDKIMTAPVTFATEVDAIEAPVPFAPPPVGADTDEVLAAAGVRPEVIATLRESGVVGG
ncbi:MAG: CaiB/BaiF CoA transferase family protein [Acidimicrobiia bacterium]